MMYGYPSQRGFAAIAAIFLVVVLAALGGFILTFSNTQQLTSAQDFQGTRAYWAARAGLEWGVSTVSTSAVCPASPKLLTVDTFTVCVTCAVQSYTEAAAAPNIHVFQLNSIARSAALASCSDLTPLVSVVGSMGYVERSLSASMER